MVFKRLVINFKIWINLFDVLRQRHLIWNKYILFSKKAETSSHFLMNPFEYLSGLRCIISKDCHQCTSYDSDTSFIWNKYILFSKTASPDYIFYCMNSFECFSGLLLRWDKNLENTIFSFNDRLNRNPVLYCRGCWLEDVSWHYCYQWQWLSDNMSVTLGDIKAAAARILGKVHRTEVRTCDTVNKITEREIFFKCEMWQKTGSFKARGMHCCQALSPNH